MDSIRLQIPAHADFIDIIRLCVYGIATKIGFSYEEIEDMKVAASEACNNALRHNGLINGTWVIDVSFEIVESGITISVKDNNPVVNHLNKIDPTSSKRTGQLSELDNSELGLYLMQALMDDVVINTENGTEVIMKKFIVANDLAKSN